MRKTDKRDGLHRRRLRNKTIDSSNAQRSVGFKEFFFSVLFLFFPFFFQIKKFALVAKICLEKTVNFVVKIITDNIFNEKVLLYNFKFYLFLLTH